MENTKDYWTQRYAQENMGWDIGKPSTPLVEYINQLTSKELRILIPGAGNGYEAQYLWEQGFKNVTVLDVSALPLQAFQERVPDFPKEQLIEQNFFKHRGTYDLIIEQTFFCSFPPTQMNRTKYATKMYSLLETGGKLVGLWFDFPLSEDKEKRPFGGSKDEYVGYLQTHFTLKTFERAHNSIPPRAGNELFGIFIKKEKQPTQVNNPLHGINLKTIVIELEALKGWEQLDTDLKMNCFAFNPSVKATLKFLRKTPWAREKVEKYYMREVLKEGAK